MDRNGVWNLVTWIESIDMTTIYSRQCGSEQKSSQNTSNLNATNGFIWFPDVSSIYRFHFGEISIIFSVSNASICIAPISRAP